MSDKFAIVICHTISSFEINEEELEGKSPPVSTMEPQKAQCE